MANQPVKRTPIPDEKQHDAYDLVTNYMIEMYEQFVGLGKEGIAALTAGKTRRDVAKQIFPHIITIKKLADGRPVDLQKVEDAKKHFLPVLTEILKKFGILEEETSKLEAAKLISLGFNKFCRSDADKTAYAADVIRLAHTMAFNGVAVPAASLDANEPSPFPTIKHKIRWSEHKSNFADPYDFLQKIYPEEIGPDLSWPRVLNLDSGLYHALKRHAGRGKLPEGVHILDRKEVTDRKYATLDPNQVRAAVNLASAVGKRKWRANRNP